MGLIPLSANLLLSQCVRYDLGNMFDPAYTMVCKLPKRFAEKVNVLRVPVEITSQHGRPVRDRNFHTGIPH